MFLYCFFSQLLNWSLTEFFISDHLIFTMSEFIWLNAILQSMKVLCVVMLALFSYAVETLFQFKMAVIVVCFQSFDA